jgi:HEAT repeat protein
MTIARLLLALFVAVPLLADNWIAWRIPTRNNVHVNGWNHCVSSGQLVMALRMDKATIEDVRFFDPACEPELDGLKPEMRTMTPEASLEFLVSHLRAADDPDDVVTAIALHEHEKVVPALIPLARNDPSTEVRRQAIFWLGQKAGEKAIGELRRSVDDDPDDDVREHAVFAISQLPNDRAVPLLIDLVKNHKSRAVRKKALFWLSQSGDPRALDLIESILVR